MMVMFHYVCPCCKRAEGRVVRHTYRSIGTSRRRIECKGCQHRWTVHENTERRYDGLREAQQCPRCQEPTGRVLQHNRRRKENIVSRRMICRQCWDRWRAVTDFNAQATAIVPTKTTREPPRWIAAVL
jgi:transcriptional regulator NrdR family protein